MGSYVVGLEQVDRTQVPVVGGKGAHLGELLRIDGVAVPDGFCVTTEAWSRIVGSDRAIEELLERLSELEGGDSAGIGALSAGLREHLEDVIIPDDITSAVAGALAAFAADTAHVVRSSATAEDLPSASFAGQHDSYLNVVGADAVLDAIRLCWASLFTERAVTYRLRNGVDQRSVQMAVVVQRLVLAEASGVLFTADPVSGNRNVTRVEACFGLGEGLVAGVVEADAWTVRDGRILTRSIATKRIATVPSAGGGTREEAVEPGRQEQPTLSDDQVLALTRLARRIEAHLGGPQDVEWSVVDGRFLILQSRPITTLFPIPGGGEDANRVYVSVGHQQMMTDPMKPLGLSFWLHTTRAPMHEAGGRLFVEVTGTLSSPATRGDLVDLFRKNDPLTGDALAAVVERDGFLGPPSEPAQVAGRPGGRSAGDPPAPFDDDPAFVTEWMEHTLASIAAAQREIATRSGAALVDFVLDDIGELRRILFDARSHQALMAGMEASWWLNDHVASWLGEQNVADTLTRSVPHNVTSEMGLALLDVADAIRPHPAVVELLEHVEHDEFLVELDVLPGGPRAREAIEGFLERYGMRCVGEIDITRPRWSERPSMLIPLILANVRNFEHGAGERLFEEGRREAELKEREVLERLRSLPDGDDKATEAKRMIDRVRAFTGFREFPKYGMISRYFVYKQALLQEAERLVQRGVLAEAEDICWLTLPELAEVVRTGVADQDLIRERVMAFRSYELLTPPRVLTSEGEVVVGRYRREDLLPGALSGLGVSAGTVEGRARVIHDVAEADLEPGDILVTAFTDPSWTPAFLSAAGLVTEVGGLMTHGAVIAREYGVPAVVAVQDATRQIRDGQQLRVNGTEGWVELL
jgi:pyruvate,water dikinase